MDLMFGVHQRLMVTLPLVQMEYLQVKEYFPLKTVIIDDSLQITLVEKSFGICLISLLVQLLF